MKLIDCPYLGPRPAAEFIYAGPWRPSPEPGACDDTQWARYVFHRQGAPGVKLEQWYHAPSGIWLVAERDTLTDTFHGTWPLSQVAGRANPHPQGDSHA